MVSFTAQQIATYLGGTVEGNPDLILSTFGRIEEGDASSLTFLSNMAYEHFIYTTQCGAVLVNKDFIPTAPVAATMIRVDDAYQALAKLLKLQEEAMRPRAEISPLAVVDPTAKIDPTAYIAPFAVIGAGAQVGAEVQIHTGVSLGRSVKIGAKSTLHPHVVVYQECVIGQECIVHAGAVIGADGFGFAPTEQGYDKIPQTGNVIIGDRVEIGANATIDRAVIGATRIHDGVKIDNLVQIGHNSEVAQHTVIAAQSGVAGSTKIGAWNRIGGQVGVAGHLHTADHVTLAAQTGVISDIKEAGVTYFGSPAQPHLRAMKAAALYIKLPEMNRELYALRKELEQLKAKLTVQQ